MRFRTADGYILEWDGEKWTDGDIAFNFGPDGMPVDDEGIPVQGDLII